MSTQRKLIEAAIARRKQWISMYSPDYIERFFGLYDSELNALLDFADEHMTPKFATDHLPEGSH